MTITRWWLGLAAAAAAVSAQDLQKPAQRKLDPLPVYSAPRTAVPVKIDGKLDDPIWQKAPAVTYLFPWTQQTGAKQVTRVRLAWDEFNLYAAYECEDSDVTAKFIEHDDPTYKDDAVELYLNPDAKRFPNAYYGFEMNARGVMYDYFLAFPNFVLVKQFDLNGARLATSIRGTLNQSGDLDQGWSLEVAIPWVNFGDLGGSRPHVGTEWRMQLVRWDGTEPNRRLSIWSDSGLEATFPHNPERLGILRFVE